MPVCPEDFVHQEFKKGGNIWFRNDSVRVGKWLPGKLIEKTRPLSYIIASNKSTTRRHIDQLKLFAIIKATHNRDDLVTIIRPSMKETHMRNDPVKSDTQNASAIVPTDDESWIHPSLDRMSSRCSSKDQTDLASDLSNAENWAPTVTRTRKDRKASKYLEDYERWIKRTWFFKPKGGGVLCLWLCEVVLWLMYGYRTIGFIIIWRCFDTCKMVFKNWRSSKMSC